MHSEGGISIWFFIGISLLVNGVLILGAGLYEAIHPPEFRVVLFNVHANIWWGALLIFFGLLYTLKFKPRPKSV
jgi:FtsH-binding integral membrane protein